MGIRKIPAVLASMPTNTGVLMLRRAISEAPSAHASGAKPTMNAMEVIITARNRNFAPSAAASVMLIPALVLGKLDDQDGVLGRHGDQHDEADLGLEIERQLSRMLVRRMLLRSRSSTASNPAEVVTSNRTPSNARSFLVTRLVIDSFQHRG
jgi:hypothetical protein